MNDVFLFLDHDFIRKTKPPLVFVLQPHAQYETLQLDFLTCTANFQYISFSFFNGSEHTPMHSTDHFFVIFEW